MMPHLIKHCLISLGLALLPSLALASEDFSFSSIDGGEYLLSDWQGRPVLVVNTASLCAFTPQYDELQALHEEYGAQGLVVLAIPSDDFAQELATEDDVVEFCELNFNLTLPMTEITRIRAPDAHPFYDWLDDAHGFRPRWNFNKVLLNGNGELVETWGSRTSPMGPQITGALEDLLAQ